VGLVPVRTGGSRGTVAGMANENMREFWTSGATGWVAHRDLFDAELAPFGDAVLAAASPGPGDRVLDVGCGTGVLVARSLAAGAVPVGVDISPTMIDGATAAVPGGRFLLADAQTDDLVDHGPFDVVISRFGVMFFDDPTAAFANIRSATVPGARLAFACWRGEDENAMFTLGTSVLLDRMDPPLGPRPPGPGPMAFADPDLVRSVLDGAGWTEIAIERFDATCAYGRDGSDGVEERLTMLLNTGAGRAARDNLEARSGPDGWAALLDEVRDELRRNLVDGEVRFTGATWLVTARNPG